MQSLMTAGLLALCLLLPGCSGSTDSAPGPAQPELQYEPPALVEVMQEPLLASRLVPTPAGPDLTDTPGTDHFDNC